MFPGFQEMVMMWDPELEALQQNSQEASLCPQYLLVLVLEIPTRRRRWTWHSSLLLVCATRIEAGASFLHWEV